MKQNLQRSIAMTFRVNEKERDMIRKAQARTKIINTRAYLLKMAVNGRVIEIDLDGVREMNRLLSNVSNNINQIAKRVNETSRIHAPVLEDIKTRQEEIWEQQKEILRRLNKIFDVIK
jgi:hypothetical protein